LRRTAELRILSNGPQKRGVSGLSFDLLVHGSGHPGLTL
jgi:hypothetical protein